MSEDSGKRLAGKVAIVTGAGRNIGRAEALLLAAQGAKVVVNDIGGAEEVVAEILALGGEAVAETSSAASFAAGEAIVAKAIATFGRIDILINNAGIVEPARIDQMDEDSWDRVINVSLKAYFATIRFASPHMIAQRSGVILNTGSSSGFGHHGMANYAAAKEGVAGLTRSVARDLGQFGIRTNLIRPVSAITGTYTPKMAENIGWSVERGLPYNWHRFVGGPMPVMPTPDPVAALAVWLCTDAAADINGGDFFIEGVEAGRISPPELIRASFRPSGWTLADFDDEPTRKYLFGDLQNPFGG